jgi:uncharacterized protein DUF4231
MATENPTIERLEDQIQWYDTRSVRNQRRYKIMKTVEIAAASLIPLAAGLGAPAYATGGLGALVTVLEGLQHLNQYHNNWITYRSTCEELKHEKYLWTANAGPYKGVEDSYALLAERTEGLISREHAKWISARPKSETSPAPPAR